MTAPDVVLLTPGFPGAGARALAAGVSAFSLRRFSRRVPDELMPGLASHLDAWLRNVFQASEGNAELTAWIDAFADSLRPIPIRDLAEREEAATRGVVS